MSQRAFTLIEIIIAMAVMALLMSFVLPQLGQSQSKQQWNHFIAQLTTITQHAQQSALQKHISHRIVLDFENHTVTSEIKQQGEWLELESSTHQQLSIPQTLNIDPEHHSDKPHLFALNVLSDGTIQPLSLFVIKSQTHKGLLIIDANQGVRYENRSN